MLPAPAMRSASHLFLALALASAGTLGCGSDSGELEAQAGPVAQMIGASADANAVPVDLIAAIGHIEGGLKLAPVREVDDDDNVPVAGVLELRHGRFDSLRRGAELMGMSERDLSIDLAAGTEAGARVLDELARETGVVARGDLGSWAAAVEKLSGHLFERDQIDYRARVFRLLRTGGLLAARGGEIVVLPPHPEIPVALTLSPPAVHTLGVPDYPGAQWIETSCVDKCNTSRNAPVSMIAIHDTEGGWDASVATLQNDPGKSCHYIVDKDGSRVGQFIPESYNGWHVGNSYYNNRMIGIEHVGYAGLDEYETSMYVASAELVKDIAARNGLAVDRDTLIAHGEVPNGNNIPQSSPPCPDSPGSCVGNEDYGGANHHTDPGVYWEWCQYLELAGGTCKCNDAFDLWNCVHDLSMMVRCPDGVVEIVHCADTCVVEPIGTDDHCTPVGETTSAAAGGGADPGVTTGGEGGSSPSTGSGIGGDPSSGSGDELDEGPGPAAASGCGCALPGGSPGSGLSWGLGLALAGLCAARRRRPG